MTTNQDFTPEQKRYLEGPCGVQTARAGRGLKFAELAAAGTLTRLSTRSHVIRNRRFTHRTG